MAKRMIDTDLWSDSKVMDEFSPQDKYFWLFLLTTRYGNLIGVFEVSKRLMAFDLGLEIKEVERLIDKFKNEYKMIDYNENTREIFIYNWYKYNWTKSPRLFVSIKNVIEEVKCLKFKEMITLMANEYEKNGTINNEVLDRVSIPYQYLSNTNTNSNTISISHNTTNLKEKIKNKKEKLTSVKEVSYNDIEIAYVNLKENEIKNTFISEVKEIVEFLNQRLGTSYRYTTKKTQDLIRARMNEGFVLNDFLTVIDKKVREWKGTEWEKYLRPETLFSNKFEGYLQQPFKENKDDKLQQAFDRFLNNENGKSNKRDEVIIDVK